MTKTDKEVHSDLKTTNKRLSKEKKTYEIPRGRMFDKFYRESHGRLMNVIIKHFGSSLRNDEMQDLCDRAFIDFHENVRSGRLKELTASPFSYLYKICWNKAVKYVRDTKNEHINTVSFDDTEEIDDSKVDELMHNALQIADDPDTIHPDDAAIENELQDIIANMPSPCAEILHSHYWEGLKYKEIAIQFHFPSPASVKTEAGRCRSKFEKKLQEIKERMGYEGILYRNKIKK